MNCLKYCRLRGLKDNCLIRLSSVRQQSNNGVNNELLDPLNSRHLEAIDVHSFDELVINDKNSDYIKRKIDLVLSEYHYQRLTSLRVPKTLTSDQMRELLDLNHSFERKSLMNFWCRKEIQRFNRKEAKNKRKVDLISENGNKSIGIWDQNQELVYGLWRNALFQRISRSTANRQYCQRLRTAALFGPKLVFDLDFEKYMKTHETRLLLKQIHFCYNYNKYETTVPFDLHFVNCNPDELSVREMARYLPNCNSSDFFVTFHYRKSYLDVFPKQRLLYLSPHADETLSAVNEDDIYIIGGLIDKSYTPPITALKAREDGIRSAKLPINSYVKWSKGSQNLCLNQVMAILHDWKQTQDWELVFRRHIPMRKLMTSDEIEGERLLSLSNSKYV